MATIYLGPSGTETLLPTITGRDGPVADTPVNVEKSIDSSRMADGSYRYAIYAKKRRWGYDWGLLTLAEKNVIENLAALNQELRLQDNHEGATWFTVLVLSFNFVELRSMSDTNKYFAASMTIVQT